MVHWSEWECLWPFVLLSCLLAACSFLQGRPSCAKGTLLLVVFQPQLLQVVRGDESLHVHPKLHSLNSHCCHTMCLMFHPPCCIPLAAGHPIQ
jgi:hypothetical protein